MEADSWLGNDTASSFIVFWNTHIRAYIEIYRKLCELRLWYQCPRIPIRRLRVSK